MAIDPQDPAVRERLAERAYYRERLDEAAVDQERSEPGEPPVAYHTLAWECLSDWAKRPYRTAVAEALDAVARAGVA